MNEVLAKRLLGACVLVGATIVLARLLPSPQTIPPPEEQAKRVTYDLRPAVEVAKIDPPPAAAETPAPQPIVEAPSAAVEEKSAPAAAVPRAAPNPPPPKAQPKKPEPVAAAESPAPVPAATPADAPAPVAAPEQAWYLQIGVFAVEANAAKSMARLRTAGLRPHQATVPVKAGKAYRVRCGPFTSREDAEQGKAKAAAIGFRDARVARD